MEQSLQPPETSSSLSQPTTDVRLRPSAHYRNLHMFQVKHRVYEQQYMDLYYARFDQLRHSARDAAITSWGEEPLDCLQHIATGVPCVLVGTLYKDMRLKPSVLAQYIQDLEDMAGAVVTSGTNCYVSEGDSLFLEDNSSRVALVAATNSQGLHVNKLVTGMVVAVRGEQHESRGFKVSDVALPNVPPVCMPEGLQSSSSPLYVAIVGGLPLGGTPSSSCSDAKLLHSDEQLERLNLLLRFVEGDLGTATSKWQQLSSRIVRLVIGGSTLASCAVDHTVLQEADRYFDRLAEAVPVDVLPGEGDPTNASLPQLPLAPTLFTFARRRKTFQSVSNPYGFELNEVRFVGCSGQAVADICRYSDNTEMEALRLIAQCRCLSPTSPDTLPSYPFQQQDLSVLGEPFPHVLFSTGCGRLTYEQLGEVMQDDEKKGPLLLCVPSFADTGEIALVDINTLNVERVKFL